MSAIEKIKDRIDKMHAGDIMVISDFADISNAATIRKSLGRCVEEGLIRRVFDGVYEKPKYSKLLKEYMPTNPEKVAYALAKNYHWTIAPCGDIALNKLGLSTQVPAVWGYVSDGPYRSFSWDNAQLMFKHRANREISKLSEQTVLLIEAIRALGKNNIDINVVEKLQKKIPKKYKGVILKEATTCSVWIYEVIKKICAE